MRRAIYVYVSAVRDNRLLATARAPSDFLVGAHALVQADALLTHDRGTYSAYLLHLTLRSI